MVSVDWYFSTPVRRSAVVRFVGVVVSQMRLTMGSEIVARRPMGCRRAPGQRRSALIAVTKLLKAWRVTTRVPPARFFVSRMPTRPGALPISTQLFAPLLLLLTFLHLRRMVFEPNSISSNEEHRSVLDE